MRAQFRPPSREALLQHARPIGSDYAHGPREKVPFDGVSTFSRDYKPPPKEALRHAIPADVSDRYMPREAIPFEGESSQHRDYRPYPPAPVCPAKIVCAAHPPPHPDGGREHVYFDPDRERWH
mmetsp:Transcript_31480/g.71871  ORF Transcript_31480/g.71871 Transcript_31480/m.71871 type:complete len:123 (+) Transcript_31480:1-369(+)